MLSSKYRIYVFLILGLGVFLLTTLAQKTMDKNKTVSIECFERNNFEEVKPEETFRDTLSNGDSTKSKSGKLGAKEWARKENITITY